MTEEEKTSLHDYMRREFPVILEGEQMKDRLVEIQEYLRRKLAEKRGEQ